MRGRQRPSSPSAIPTNRQVATGTVVADPGRRLVEHAAGNDVDQIVIGSHGREDDERLRPGSVTDLVVFRSTTRVLLVR